MCDADVLEGEPDVVGDTEVGERRVVQDETPNLSGGCPTGSLPASLYETVGGDQRPATITVPLGLFRAGQRRPNRVGWKDQTLGLRFVENRTLDDPEYRAAMIDLLGLLAYGELQGFTRMAADSTMAPTLAEQAQAAAIAATEFRQFERLAQRLIDVDADPEDAMTPFVESIDTFHQDTAPSDWWESLVKIYVGDGIARDFYLEMSTFVDPETSQLVRSVFADRGQADFVVTSVRQAIEADPTIAGRLALWARRLVGEALSQAQRVSAERDSFTTLLVAGDGGLDLAGVGALFERMTARHTARMESLGLAP